MYTLDYPFLREIFAYWVVLYKLQGYTQSLLFAGTVIVKCLAQKYNTMSAARVRTGPVDPESSALTVRS